MPSPKELQELISKNCLLMVEILFNQLSVTDDSLEETSLPWAVLNLFFLLSSDRKIDFIHQFSQRPLDQFYSLASIYQCFKPAIKQFTLADKSKLLEILLADYKKIKNLIALIFIDLLIADLPESKGKDNGVQCLMGFVHEVTKVSSNQSIFQKSMSLPSGNVHKSQHVYQILINLVSNPALRVQLQKLGQPFVEYYLSFSLNNSVHGKFGNPLIALIRLLSDDPSEGFACAFKWFYLKNANGEFIRHLSSALYVFIKEMPEKDKKFVAGILFQATDNFNIIDLGQRAYGLLCSYLHPSRQESYLNSALFSLSKESKQISPFSCDVLAHHISQKIGDLEKIYEYCLLGLQTKKDAKKILEQVIPKLSEDKIFKALDENFRNYVVYNREELLDVIKLLFNALTKGSLVKFLGNLARIIEVRFDEPELNESKCGGGVRYSSPVIQMFENLLRILKIINTRPELYRELPQEVLRNLVPRFRTVLWQDDYFNTVATSLVYIVKELDAAVRSEFFNQVVEDFESNSRKYDLYLPLITLCAQNLTQDKFSYSTISKIVLNLFLELIRRSPEHLTRFDRHLFELFRSIIPLLETSELYPIADAFMTASADEGVAKKTDALIPSTLQALAVLVKILFTQEEKDSRYSQVRFIDTSINRCLQENSVTIYHSGYFLTLLVDSIPQSHMVKAFIALTNLFVGAPSEKAWVKKFIYETIAKLMPQLSQLFKEPDNLFSAQVEVDQLFHFLFFAKKGASAGREPDVDHELNIIPMVEQLLPFVSKEGVQRLCIKSASFPIAHDEIFNDPVLADAICLLDEEAIFGIIKQLETVECLSLSYEFYKTVLLTKIALLIEKKTFVCEILSRQFPSSLARLIAQYSFCAEGTNATSNEQKIEARINAPVLKP